MKINAVIESKDGGTLVLDFPRSIYDVYEKLQSVGIRQSPHQVTLSDEDGDDVRVKLYSESEVGKHLLLTLNDRNSLADANMLAFMVDNAKLDFRSKLEQMMNTMKRLRRISRMKISRRCFLCDGGAYADQCAAPKQAGGNPANAL